MCRCVASQASVRSSRCALAHVHNHALTRTPAKPHTHMHFFQVSFLGKFQKFRKVSKVLLVSLPKISAEFFGFLFFVLRFFFLFFVFSFLIFRH